MAITTRILEHVLLAPMTTLGVGGAAEWFFDAASEADVEAGLAWARERGLPVTVLGGGSNVLVADRGVRGLVLRANVRGFDEASGADDVRRLRVGAGEALDDLVERSVRGGLAGLECLSGIPGLVGATPIQNVGAYGQEVGDTIVEVRAIERATGAVRVFDNAACGFGYRTSAWKREWRGLHVVVSVTFALRPGGHPFVGYAELARHLAAGGHAAPSLAVVRAAVIELRRSKSMVLDPHDPNRRSAGSFFVNPVVSASEADEVEARAAVAPGSMPRFPSDGRVKLSAGWLIERAGYPRGSSEGPVGLSTRHALAVVNRGGATAADVVAFAARVRAAVRDRFGVSLAHEPELVGFEPGELGALA